MNLLNDFIRSGCQVEKGAGIWRSGTVTQSRVQLLNPQWKDLCASLEENNTFATYLNFAIAWETDLFPPLFRSIPKKQVRTVQRFPLVVDSDACLHLKRWQRKNVRLCFCLLHQLVAFLLRLV